MKIYIYSGTHWDREWYNTFQGFRAMLVRMTDALLTGLETTPDYGVFHFDGQTVVLEDYLEIRPEHKDRLTSLIQQGKIVIGPWYDMPDEFLISGESMIKNLQLGMATARSFGVEPSHNAYICDIFGHSSQTPQIFAGMNLHHTVLGRGTNEDLDPVHFRWQALDGTEVLVYRLREGDGYGDFTAFINRTPSTLPQAELDAAVKAYVDDELARSGIPVVTLFDALDHLPFRADTARYVESLKRCYPDAEIYHVAIDEMNKVQSEYASTLEVRVGELCRPGKIHAGYIHVITNTLSSRYPLKRYNDINQMRLEKWVSPLYAFRRTDMAEGFLRTANKYLLKNHPHDSICGCSIDQVHQDMMFRFDQTRLLCDEILNPFHASLSGDLSADVLTDGEAREGLRLRVFNPLPYRAKRTVVASVCLRNITHYNEPFFGESVPAFKLYDAQDNQLDYGFVRPLGGENYEISFEAEISPCGVTEFSLRPSGYPTRNPSRLLTSSRSAEGDKIAITVNDNGTVDLYDKENDQLYRNLLTMIDDGEIGDGWYHCGINVDKIVTPTSADVQIIENSPIRTTFRIVQKMALPVGVENDCGIHRSDETVDYCIMHDVTLAKGDRGITVHTVIDNNACDHRLRLRLPETVPGDTYEAAQAFGYVTRECGDDTSTAEWKEYFYADRNMANICAKRNGNRGLAFISAYGLHECGVWPNGDIDVTLMRCFSKTIRTAGEPGGQLLQNLEYSFRIQPFTDADRFADLQKEQDYLSTGMSFATIGGGKAQEYRPMLEVIGTDLIYSTANKVEDGASEVRIFNDGPNAQKATILLPAFASAASMTEIDGRHICDLQVKDGKVIFDLPAFRIATVRFS